MMSLSMPKLEFSITLSIILKGTKMTPVSVLNIPKSKTGMSKTEWVATNIRPGTVRDFLLASGCAQSEHSSDVLG